MLTIEITEHEQKQLIECMDVTIRNAQSALIAASQLLPLAAKVQNAKPQEQVVRKGRSKP